MVKRLAAVVLIMATCLGLSGIVYAEEKTPDATLTLTQGQVAAGIGWSWGKGVLTYQGKEYPFKVKGLYWDYQGHCKRQRLWAEET